MNLKKSFRKNKKSSEKKIAAFKEWLTPYRLSLFCFVAVLMMVAMIFFGRVIYHLSETTNEYKSRSISVVENKALTLHTNDSAPSRPIHFEFYSSLPNMKVKANERKENDLADNSIVVPSQQPKKPAKPRVLHPMIGNAKELERDVLLQIKRKP